MNIVRWMDELLAHLFVGLIKIYKLTLSPWLGQQCRFYPTCSSYATAALLQHGGAHGLWLTLKRLARCHPFAEGGVDEVPPKGCTSTNKDNECCVHGQHVGEV